MKGLIGSAKIKIVCISIIGLLLVYSLLGFLVFPMVLSHQLPKLVQEQLNRKLHIDDIQFNPFSMELNFDGLELKNLDDSVFIRFERLYGNVAVLQSALDLTLSMDQLLLQKPYFFVKRDKKGDFNFTDLVTDESTEDAKDSSGDIFPFSISKVAVVEGKLSWEDDYSSKFQREDIYPLDLNVDNFTTLINKQSELGFLFKFASGGQFDWNGTISLNPFESHGHIKLAQVNFQRIWELFLQDQVEFEILKGSELIEADYQFTDTKEAVQLVVDNAHVHLFDIQLAEKGKNESVLSVPDFKITGIAVDLLEKNIEVAEVSASDAFFKTWLNANGSLNYQTMFAGKTEGDSISDPEQAESDEKKWNVKVGQLALKNFALNFVDNSLKKPVHLDLSSLNLAMNNLTDDLSLQLPFNLGVNINNTGSLNLQGHAVPEPFSSHLKLDAGKISIKPFQPYIEQFVRLDVISGLLNVNADLTISQAENKPLAIRFQGDSNVTEFVTRDQLSNKDFMKWKTLSLNKMDLDLAANSYTIDTVKIDQPYARVLIRKDKTINVSDVVVDTTAGKKAAVEQKQKTKNENDASYKIGHIEMINGDSDFTDLSLILPFSAHLNKLNGTVKGISSVSNAVAKVALAGRVESLAPVKIKGKLVPSRGDSEIVMDFHSMPLPLVTPYMAEFAGRKIEKGNMSLKLNYKIKKNQLTASNDLLIDQLVLGEQVENPEAVSLPLDLAIALLEDSDGKINMDVPITGNLDDPKFSVAGIVVDALVNVISKVITSPFNAIASLVDSDGDISKVGFLPGKTILNEQEIKKLDELAKALASRPGLKLEIKGTAFTKQDWPELQLEALNNKLLQDRVDALNLEREKKIQAEHFKLSDEEYNDLLADLFIKEYPQLAERSLFGQPRLLNPESGDFYEIAKAKLSAAISPNIQRLQKLASIRGQEIAKHMVNQGVEVERVFLQGVDVDPKDADGTISSILNLGVN